MTTLAVLAGTIITTAPARGKDVVPNDSRFHQQWGLFQTGADQAWSIATGATQVAVAVLDSGMDYTHPDLYLNIWINEEEIPPHIDRQLIDVDGDGLMTFWDLNEPVNQGPGKITDINNNGYIDGGDLLPSLSRGGWGDSHDNEGNGYIDDLIGWDFFDEDNDPMDSDPVGHGTAVAGIIGAVGNNGVGVTGINWKIRMMALRNQAVNGTAIFETPGGLEKVLLASLDGVAYALNADAWIVNISGAAPEALVPADLIDRTNIMMREAAERDVLVVVAAGNQGLDTDVVPYLQSAVPHDNVISVAATFRQQDRLAFYGGYWASNYGATTVDLGAPGDMIWTAVPNSFSGDPYRLFGGTSGATPFVTGAAALLLSVNPDLSFDELRSLILDNVDPVKDLQGITVTGGRLDILKAVQAAASR